MARKKNKRRRKNSFTIPLAPVIGTMPLFVNAIPPLVTGDVSTAIRQLAWDTLGYNLTTNKFDIMKLGTNMLPVIAGALIHKYVGGKLGVNRTLAQAGVPVIRI